MSFTSVTCMVVLVVVVVVVREKCRKHRVKDGKREFSAEQ